jgi:hypothetical protein
MGMTIGLLLGVGGHTFIYARGACAAGSHAHTGVVDRPLTERAARSPRQMTAAQRAVMNVHVTSE